MVKQHIGLVFVVIGAAACNVESKADEGTGGIGDDDTASSADDDTASDDDEQPGDNGENDDDVAPTGDAGGSDTSDDDSSGDAGGSSADAGDTPNVPPLVCPDGITVVMSDFFSTQVALGTVEGETLSASFISTGSSQTEGLAFALSGDVVVPTQAPESGRVVLLDRFGTNVVTWLDPGTGDVLGQLPVGMGFESNPQDYIELGDGTALISRMGQNGEPGREDFDRGGDVLIVDTEDFTIEGSIELPIEDDLPPGPASMVRQGDRVLLNLERYALDFSETGEAMWASISIADRALEWVEPLPGFKDCGAPVSSPDGSQLAMACTGRIEYDGSIQDISQSAILLLDPSEDPPAIVETYAAEEIAGEPLQDTIAFASDNLVLFKTQTSYGGPTNNRLFSLQLGSGTVTELVEARPDPDLGGKGIVFGAIRCAPGCTDICLMTDSDRGVLRPFRIVGDEVRDLRAIEVDESVGLPPIDVTYR